MLAAAGLSVWLTPAWSFAGYAPTHSSGCICSWVRMPQTLSCPTAHNHCVPCRALEAITEFFSYCFIGQEPLMPAMLRDPEGTHVDLLLLLQRKVAMSGFVPPENAVKGKPEVMAVGVSILPYSARTCHVRPSFRAASDRSSLTVQSPCLATPSSGESGSYCPPAKAP